MNDLRRWMRMVTVSESQHYLTDEITDMLDRTLDIRHWIMLGEAVIRVGDLRVFKNPNPQQIRSLRERDIADHQTHNLRGILTRQRGDLYVWSAYGGVHHDLSGELGLRKTDCINLQLMPDKVYCYSPSLDDVASIRNHFSLVGAYGRGFVLLDYARNPPREIED